MFQGACLLAWSLVVLASHDARLPQLVDTSQQRVGVAMDILTISYRSCTCMQVD